MIWSQTIVVLIYYDGPTYIKEFTERLMDQRVDVRMNRQIKLDLTKTKINNDSLIRTDKVRIFDDN